MILTVIAHVVFVVLILSLCLNMLAALIADRPSEPILVCMSNLIILILLGEAYIW